MFFNFVILTVRHYNRAIYLSVAIKYQVLMLKINLTTLSSSTTTSTWLKAQEIVATEAVELRDVNENKAISYILYLF